VQTSERSTFSFEATHAFKTSLDVGSKKRKRLFREQSDDEPARKMVGSGAEGNQARRQKIFREANTAAVTQDRIVWEEARGALESWNEPVDQETNHALKSGGTIIFGERARGEHQGMGTSTGDSPVSISPEPPLTAMNFSLIHG
jgi:hypothetical protein